MRTPVLGLLLLATPAFLGAQALAAPFTAPPPSYAKVASWKQRFLERRDSQWRKPAGEMFPRLAAERQERLPITKPLVQPPPAKNITANNTDPRIRVQAKVATADKNAPFDNTAGFGKHIRRSTSLDRITWEKRAGKLARRVAMVFKAGKAKRQALLGSAEGSRSSRPKVFRANGKPTFRAVKPRPAPVFRRPR